MKKKNITIDELAVMVQKGLAGNGKRFDDMDKRFDRLEKLIIEDHRRRIERLEAEVKELRELFAM